MRAYWIRVIIETCRRSRIKGCSTIYYFSGPGVNDLKIYKMAPLEEGILFKIIIISIGFSVEINFVMLNMKNYVL